MSEQGDDRMEEDLPENAGDESMEGPEEGTLMQGGGGDGHGGGEKEQTPARRERKLQWPPEPETRKQSTIVIQPGSDVLRVGWAGDEAPKVVPHCLARLQHGPVAPPPEEKVATLGSERERERELGDAERSVKKWSGPTQKRSIAGSSEVVEEEVLEAGPDEPHAYKLLGVEGGDDGDAPRKVYYGEEAQKVTAALRSDGSRYVMRRLVRRGRVSITHEGYEAAICDFQNVWEHAIRDLLGHDLSQIESNLCVLIVPANVCKSDVKFYMTLLAQRMRFRGVCVLQDSISACYASSIITSCIVDIGHQKTSVSIVEDGVCVPATCQMAPYGGDDIGRTLEWMLRSRAGVLAPLDLSEPPHEMSLQGLKERVCYFLPAQQDVTTRVEEIAVHKPGHPTMMHRLRIGSAACVAPMGVFHPKMMQPGDQQRSHRKPWRDAEEVCDDDYVAEMLLTRPGGAGQSHQDDKLNPRDEHIFPPDGTPLLGVDVMIRDAIARAHAVHEANAKDASAGGKDGKQEANKAQEALQKLYGNIVIVGGGAEIKGIAETLQQRVMGLKPPNVNSVSVQINPRDRDSIHMSWVGGGIIASVESFKEVFVSREEWELKGVAILREKVMFPW